MNINIFPDKIYYCMKQYVGIFIFIVKISQKNAGFEWMNEWIEISVNDSFIGLIQLNFRLLFFHFGGREGDNYKIHINHWDFPIDQNKW